MNEQDELSAAAEIIRRATTDLVSKQLSTVRDFRLYNGVADEDIKRSSYRNVARVVAILEGRRTLPARITEDERESGRRRALQGVPAIDVASAYRAVMGVLRDAFINAASDLRLSANALSQGIRDLWEITDVYSDELITARLQIDNEVARRDERERSAFLQRILGGSLLSDEIGRVGATFGLVSGVEYWVFRARLSESGAHALNSRVEPILAGHHSAPLIGPIDADLAGLTLKQPTIRECEGTLAIAGPAALFRVHDAFCEATQLLNAALRFGQTGVVTIDRLSIRLAIARDDVVGDALLQRYVAPILATNKRDQAIALLESVIAFLHGQRRVSAVAAALYIHENTLRNRLERYERMVKVNLADTEAIIEVWWALEYWKLNQRAREQPRTQR
jgi:hypothetical protein